MLALGMQNEYSMALELLESDGWKHLLPFREASSEGTNRKVIQAMEMAWKKVWDRTKGTLGSWQNCSQWVDGSSELGRGQMAKGKEIFDRR